MFEFLQNHGTIWRNRGAIGEIVRRYQFIKNCGMILGIVARLGLQLQEHSVRWKNCGVICMDLNTITTVFDSFVEGA